MGTARRMAGVLAGVVLGGATVGLGVAHADGIVWGCPSGYSLAGTTCRSTDGSTVGALGLLPGDVDPVTGAVLLPGTTESEPTDPAPRPATPPATPPTSTAPATTVPAPGSTTTPPGGRPCVATTPAVGNADPVRTAAAVDEARARLAADVRRGAPPAVIRADAQALATAIRAHAAALTPPRPPAACPTR